jgi:uncharacterized protein YdaU (DUF1376 family)
LIELYYDTENPLIEDITKLSRLVLANSEEELTAVVQVLDEYFILTNKGFVNSRCNKVIKDYRSMKVSKSNAGKASAIARKSRKTKGKAGLTGVEQVLNSVPTEAQQNPTNHKPITNNHKPCLKPLGNGLPESENEVSEEKKIKREARTILINQAFDFFWKAWPTKKNKDKAFKSFTKVCGSKNDEAVEELTNTLCSDIDKRLQANDFGFDRMYATTYLNNKRWEDDISAGDYQ